MLKHLLLSLMLILAVLSMQGQITLERHNALVFGSEIHVSISTEQWLDSNKYQFLVITFMEELDTLHSISSLNLGKSRQYHNLQNIWVVQGDCDLFPLQDKVVNPSVENKRNQRILLFLIDDFDPLPDSLELRLEVMFGYFDQGQAYRTKYPRVVSIETDLKPGDKTIPLATKAWYREWKQKFPEVLDNRRRNKDRKGICE